MTTDEALNKLTSFIDPKSPEWVELIYGNAWEIHFMNNNTQIASVVGLRTDIAKLVEMIIPQIENYKKGLKDGSK